jgi:hypothetical protein
MTPNNFDKSVLEPSRTMADLGKQRQAGNLSVPQKGQQVF